MIIVLFTNDLMFQSRIASIVRNSGGQLIVARDIDALATRLPADQPPSTIVFDLSAPGLDLDRLVGELRERYADTRQVAYGPHVDAERLQHAADLGVDDVLTRGQFDRNMASILR